MHEWKMFEELEPENEPIGMAPLSTDVLSGVLACLNATISTDLLTIALACLNVTTSTDVLTIVLHA